MACIVGITGIIGSGKSLLSSLFTENHFLHINVDQIGKDALSLPDLQHQMRQVFPQHIFNAEGFIITSLLRDIVFEDIHYLNQLNSIIHPVMRNMIIEKLKIHKNQNIIIDAALLLQMRLQQFCHSIIWVKVSTDIAIQRIQKRNPTLPLNMIYSIINIQKEYNHFSSYADIIILNNTTRDQLMRKFNCLYFLIKG